MILDTNIISEMMRPNPNASVLAWLDQQDAADLFVTAITIGEVFYGLEALPPGRRRQRLVAAFERLIREAFDTRLLIFDETAARHYGTVMATRRKMGKPLSALDGQIAATALANRMTVVTRNTKDFADCGLKVIDPFVG
jgi:hypothetical protein